MSTPSAACVARPSVHPSIYRAHDDGTCSPPEHLRRRRSEHLEALIAREQQLAVAVALSWTRSQSKQPEPQSKEHRAPGTICYEVTLSIEPPSPSPSPAPSQSSHPVNVTILILVSLPPTYPTSAPPQLQLLSRYIGPYGVDAPLFGTVLRTYISRGAVEWVPGAECVFDGLEWVKERCVEWMGERLSERRAGELMREDGRARARAWGHEGQREDGNEPEEVRDERDGSGSGRRGPAEMQMQMPPGITIVEAEAIQDRKSSFVRRACRVTDPSQVPIILAHLMS